MTGSVYGTARLNFVAVLREGTMNLTTAVTSEVLTEILNLRQVCGMLLTKIKLSKHLFFSH